VTSYKIKNAKPEVTDHFQDDSRRRVRNSSACYKIGNYIPIFMKIDTQTKTGTVSSEMTKAEVYGHFKMAAAAIFESEVRDHFSRWQPTPFQRIETNTHKINN
jgi:hypothetical protein